MQACARGEQCKNLAKLRLFARILNLDTEERNRQHDDEQHDAGEEDRGECYRGLTGASLAGREKLRDADHLRPNRASQQGHSRNDLPPVWLKVEGVNLFRSPPVPKTEC